MMSGFKKPLNMLENPIYPDIKQAGPQFKNSGKHFVVDTGRTLMDKFRDTESSTQLLGDSILAQSRDYNRDHNGHTSYQEKITVFRPPLRNAYEDDGPLNRLPTKLHAIQPRLNPAAAHGGQGTSTFAAHNESVPELNKYITEKIATRDWRETFFAPMSGPEDGNIVQPDLMYNTLPEYSVSAGFTTQNTKDAYNPQSDYLSEVRKAHANASASAGYTTTYNIPLSQQTTSFLPGGELVSNLPEHSVSSGFTPITTINGSTGIENFELEHKMPTYSASSGYTTFSIDGDVDRDYDLKRNTPSTSVSSGYHSDATVNGESHLEDLILSSKLFASNRVLNPGSETGYQTRLDSYTTPEQHLKIRENPHVPIVAHHENPFRELNSMTKNFHVRTKTEPVKSYGSGLNTGTIKTAGVAQVQVKLKQDSMKGTKVYNPSGGRK